MRTLTRRWFVIWSLFVPVAAHAWTHGDATGGSINNLVLQNLDPLILENGDPLVLG